MSVIIKDMPMPKDCGSCFLNEYMTCTFLDENASLSGKLDNCPLEEQKTGKWIDKWYCSNMSGYEYAMNCSVCGKPTYRISLVERMPNYCPNCGARMVENG